MYSLIIWSKSKKKALSHAEHYRPCHVAPRAGGGWGVYYGVTGLEWYIDFPRLEAK